MNDKPTEEQLKRIEQSVKLPIVPDEDCPVYTYKQLTGLYAVKKVTDTFDWFHN